MKKKIKTWLIHWLGGVTEEEFEKKESLSYKVGKSDGRFDAYEAIKDYAESLNGCDAESWCLQVWNYINAQIEEDTK